MTWKPDLCIYHGGCDDGFGAAWAISKRWPDCEFVPGYYGKPLPDVSGRDVLFVDFSAKIEWIWENSFKSRSMVIIDHHKTAQADLQRLPPFDGTMAGLDAAFKINWTQNTPEIAAWFDMDQSRPVRGHPIIQAAVSPCGSGDMGGSVFHRRRRAADHAGYQWCMATNVASANRCSTHLLRLLVSDIRWAFRVRDIRDGPRHLSRAPSPRHIQLHPRSA